MFDGVVPKLEVVAAVEVVWFLTQRQLELSPVPEPEVSAALKAPAVFAAVPCKHVHLVLYATPLVEHAVVPALVVKSSSNVPLRAGLLLVLYPKAVYLRLTLVAVRPVESK